MAEEKEPLVAVYLSFKTFQSSVESLRTHGLPNKLDRSAWNTRSSVDQGQIMSAFKFLGLVDQSGNTQETLKKLVSATSNSNDEKNILKELLKERYPKVFALDLNSATPLQFVEAIGSYNATGSTRDRAVRFFIKAAGYAGISLSKRLNKAAGNGKRGATKQKRQDLDGELPLPEYQSEAEHKGQQIKTIDLPDVNGKLTISGTFNAFELAGRERQLVYDIIDKMIEFEKGPTQQK